MAFEAILFDNDGVLVDTEALYFRATREVLASVGVDLAEGAYAQLFLAEGRGAWHLAEEAGIPPAQVAELKARRHARYAELLAREDLLLDGVAGALAALGRRFRMAVVTSSERAHFEAAHRKSGLLGHFEFVLTREQYGKSKPDPEPYLVGVDRLGLPLEKCLAVEDSERGLRAAKAAGLACWVVPHGLSRRGSFAEADRVFGSLPELAAALLDPTRPS